jgi:alkaline phosphatase D
MFRLLQNSQILKILFLVFFANWGVAPIYSQLVSGPMIGAVDFKEVKIWLQTQSEKNVYIKYRRKGSSDRFLETQTVLTNKDRAFTAVLVADKVEPGTEYEYEISVSGEPVISNVSYNFKTQKHWQYRTNPPEFSFLAGSCVYVNDSTTDRPGKPYGGDVNIFNSMANHNADFMLWLGDNTYYREVDWNTRTGMLYRNTHTRKLPEMQALLSKMAHYAIWDDHDFGPNNSDRSFWNKETAREVFTYFWANPSYGLPNNGGITSMFTWNDVDVFLLDNRHFRSPNERKSGERTILGKNQLEWLKDALASSTAPFKIVAMGGQLLSDARKYEMYSNYGFETERKEIITYIQEEGIKGVVFINGDRHHTELSVLKDEGKPAIYDLTVSPLTSGSHFSDEVNNLRVPETYVAEQNYAEIFVKGPYKKRYIEVVVFDKLGKKLWEKRLEP